MQDFNYHTHTYRCGHADSNMNDEDYIKALIKVGFKKMAFTDHAPQKEKIDTRLYMRMEYSQASEYISSINKLKEKYKDIIDIQTGFEIEYLPDQESNLIELKKMTDKLILGQHFIYNEDKSALKVYRINEFNYDDMIRYGTYVKRAMEIGLVDIVAHPDVFMLSCPTFGKGERDASEIICKTAKETGIPLEINLAQAQGLISNPNAKIQYPVSSFWEIASHYNVNVIYGIDAHNKEQILNYEKSIEIANKIIGNQIINKLNFISI